MQDEIRDSIQENQNQRKLNILKGFSDLDNFFEKAVYADNAQNQKLGRVGKTYGGTKKEDEPTGNKKSGEATDSNSKQSIDPEKIKGHLSMTSSETLKKFISNKDSDPNLVEFAKKELEDRGKDDESLKREAEKNKKPTKK